MLYRDRTDAGRMLVRELSAYQGDPAVTVLALPRGGVPVAFEVAQGLGVPLDVFIVRKLGTPWQKELAMGAIASGGVRVLNRKVIDSLKIPDWAVEEVAVEEEAELHRREIEFRGTAAIPHLRDRKVILIDDGLATGATMRAAIAAVKALKPKKLIVAVPVAAKQTCREIAREVDQVICGATPDSFEGVGQFYADFTQTTDQEVRSLLQQARMQA